MAWANKKANGSWVGRYRDASGRSRSVLGTFPTEAQAKAAAEIQESRIGRGVWLDPSAGERTFGEYFEYRWMDPVEGRELTPNGRRNYWARYNRWLKPMWGQVPLRDITQRRVQGWSGTMKGQGASPLTIRENLTLLGVVLAAKRGGVSALNDGIIDFNPCDGITRPSAPEREVSIYTPDQVDALINALDPWWRLLVWVDTEIGARWSELMGLRVKDVDFLRRRIVIAQPVVQPGIKYSGTGTPFVRNPVPKSGKPRSQGISVETAEMLAEHVRVRGLGPDDALFAMPVLRRSKGFQTKQMELVPEVLRTDVWPEGHPIDRNYFRRVWIAAVAEAGVPMRRRHDLRASFVSWLLDDPSLSTQQVMDLAGHRNWATTRKYAKSLDHTQEAGVEAIANIRKRFRQTGTEEAV